MFNIGGSAAQFAIGLRNDTGATREVGDVVQVKIANLSPGAPMGGGAATGFEADLPRWLGTGLGDGNRVASGVVVGKPGSTFRVGDDMMVQVYGPVKAKVTLGAGLSSVLYQDLTTTNAAVGLTPVAKINFNAATTTLQEGQIQRAVSREVVTNTAAVTADVLCSVYLKWPAI